LLAGDVAGAAGRHSPVPANLALAAAEVLLHLAECHGGGALVIFVRMLSSWILKIVGLEGCGLEGLDGLDGMSVRKKKRTCERARRTQILIPWGACATRSQRVHPQHAQNLTEMLGPDRCCRADIGFVVGAPVWLLGHQRFAVSALKGPSDLSWDGLSWQQHSNSQRSIDGLSRSPWLILPQSSTD
jgi:hypothetical protein